MHQRRLAQLLLRPSLFSSILITLLVLVILVVALWPETVNNPVLSPYLYGPYGIFTVLDKSSEISRLTSSFLDNTTTYNVVILVIAILVAAGVYMILQVMSKIIVGSYDTWHTIHDAGSSAPVVEKEIGARLTVRLMSVLLWIAFSFFFWSLLLPYSIFTTQAGISNLLSWGVLNAILGFSVLFASLHLHVVFLRLMLLRPRVFGGKLDILDTIYQDDI